MTLTYDPFWSFRSPCSYLPTPRLLELECDFDDSRSCGDVARGMYLARQTFAVAFLSTQSNAGSAARR